SDKRLTANAIDWLKERAQAQFRMATATSDSIAEAMMRELGSADAMARLKRESTNEALSRLAQGKDKFEQIAVYPDKMVRKRQPIYEMPENRHGRAHLYSPMKRVGDTMIPTVLFNCLVIWAFVGICYVTLYFDLLRRFFDKLENNKKRKIKEQLEKLRL
ncbi:MAG: hypothetical protein U0K36_07825, partial [Bacteroidales bacterium]|nr:hypothetical protein [Bacteroidales bacterium]